MKLQDIATCIPGSPQFRIRERSDKKATLYTYYGQAEMENDLTGVEIRQGEGRQIETLDKVQTLQEGEIVFSLISGMATIVGKCHEGFLCTQNYVRIKLQKPIEPKYMVYLLNENHQIKRQLQLGLQGTVILKYTVRQLRDLTLPELPSREKQRLISEIYFNQLRLQALRERAAKLETLVVLKTLKEV